MSDIEIVQISIFFIDLSIEIVERLLIMICMIPKLNLGAREIGFMFCDLHASLKQASSGDINSMNLPCLTSVLPGDTSDSRNSSFHFSTKTYVVGTQNNCLNETVQNHLNEMIFI